MTSSVPEFLHGKEFLVLNKQPADVMRRVMAEANPSARPGPGLAMGSLRSIILASLQSGEAVGDDTPTTYGLRRVFRCEILVTELPISCEVDLIWGVGRDGKPKIAPDGKSQMVFLTRFRGTVKRKA